MAHARTAGDVVGDGRDVDGLDIAALDRHLRRELPGFVTGPLRARLLAGGHSNLTYAVDDGSSTWVLRRPPLGHTAPAAHDMARECTAMRSLADTLVPVPRVLHLCTDPTVLGAPFYLSELVDGVVYRTAEDTAELTRARAEGISFALIDTLADLHAVVPEDVGLEGFGRPEGFLERQVARWTEGAERLLTDQPAIAAIVDRLRRETPATSRIGVVHGDYRLDNVMIGRDDSLVAVLDWEMATIGDPLTDLGLLWCYWQGVDNPGGDTMRKGIDPARGFPDMLALVDRYSSRSGRDVGGSVHWYVALGYLKLAVLRRTIHQRYLEGNAPAGFSRVGELVGPLVSASLSTLESA